MILMGLLLAGAVGAFFGYRYITAGGMRARQKPTVIESYVAAELVKLSIPAGTKDARNPLDAHASSADVAAGRELYQKDCVVCHGTDGAGPTSAGSGLFPPPPSLQPAALAERKRSDGELFYFIRNGVRNTGMPGWQLPDRETWQLVSYIRNLPLTAAATASAQSVGSAAYVGSAECARCHDDIYQRWSKTPMANVVRDPKQHPDVIIPDLSKGDAPAKFSLDDVALVYGNLWKQRYFKRIGDDYYVIPAQWDVTRKQWKPYFVKDDWWAPLYPPDNFKRPTSALCDGCHSVNFNLQKHTVTEWNVGCEKCHGPGSEHVKNAVAKNILNPARMNYVAANDNCIQCHSQGRPLTNPIEDKYYDWPVGYDVSKKLSDYWRLEEHKLGETSFTHFPDGTAHKNRMQGNDFVTSQMYTHGVTCFTCHDAHGTANPSQLRKPANVLCLDCHGPASPNGPRELTLEQHTHHKAGSAGSDCVACHMPKIAQTLPGVNVRSHTFRFVSPAKTESLKIPNACTVCHTDQQPKWAEEALLKWSERSPWRTED